MVLPVLRGAGDWGCRGWPAGGWCYVLLRCVLVTVVGLVCLSGVLSADEETRDRRHRQLRERRTVILEGLEQDLQALQIGRAHV